LQTLVQDVLARSNGIGAAQLLAEAAQQDVEEARASKRPQAAFNAALTPSLSRTAGRWCARVQRVRSSRRAAG